MRPRLFIGSLVLAALAVSIAAPQVEGKPVAKKSTKKTTKATTTKATTTVAVTTAASPSAAPATSAAPVTTVAVANGGATADAIRKRGKIVIGVKFDVPLFGLKNPVTGDVEGFDAEMGKLIAKAIFGKDYNDKRIEFVEAISRNREPFIQAGTVDIVISTYTINADRKKVVDFAGPYYVAGQDILIYKIDKETIKSVDDLNGKKVCSVQGSTSIRNLATRAPKAAITEFDTYSRCVEALRDGRVDAVTTDDIILAGFQAKFSALALVGKPFTTEPYGIGMKLGDTPFRSFINDVVELAYKDGSWKQAFESTVGEGGIKTPEPPKVDRY